MAALNVMKGPSDCVMKLGKANYLSRRRNSLPVLQGAVRGEERKLARRATIMSMKKDQEWKWCLDPLEVAEEKQIVSVRKLSGSSTASTSTVRKLSGASSLTDGSGRRLSGDSSSTSSSGWS
ncbi:hypothetical protein TrST_g12148 [Triparma strigata]|uniref:Uncharacterized protein n=1 Tax=Triparma strigata TaxID=1606541 RepID=A0A9W7B585_9STRA|nr:hypothetical protein TrST_g12148 [Triparma strigata]